jgi:DNA repair ATPase RecN
MQVYNGKSVALMRVETAVNRIIERTQRDIKSLNNFEQTYGQFCEVTRGETVNLEQVEKVLADLHEQVHSIRGSLLTGLGHLKEQDLREILHRYRGSATHIYSLLEAYARYDETYLQQALELAEPDVREKAIANLPAEIRDEYRQLLNE